MTVAVRGVTTLTIRTEFVDRRLARLNPRPCPTRRHRFPSSAPPCPAGHDLRLRWLAALGPARGIFIVVQGLEFDVAGRALSRHCRLLGAAQPRASGLVQPDAAAGAGLRRALLALNILELAGLLFFTGGLREPVLDAVSGAGDDLGPALPIRLTIALGGLAVACATVLVFFHLPLPWDGDDPLVLPPIYWSASGSRSWSRSASPASTRPGSPRKRASSPTRWPRPNSCWPVNSI